MSEQLVVGMMLVVFETVEEGLEAVWFVGMEVQLSAESGWLFPAVELFALAMSMAWRSCSTCCLSCVSL